MYSKLYKALLFIGLLLPTYSVGQSAGDTSGVKSPNIMIIFANDLGIGDLGVYGQKKIETPNIDSLAKSGMCFTNFYSGAPTDAPSLGILLTGKHAGHSAIRGTDEWMERGNVTNYAKVLLDSTLEGQRPLPAGEKTLADILKSDGYKTGVFGIWSLGSVVSDGAPKKHGFDEFYGYDCLRQAQTYYPKYLWRNDRKVLMDNSLVFPNMKLANGANPKKEESYAFYTLDHYAPDSIFAETQKFITKNKEKPFFLLFSSPMVKGPLQAPTAWVRKYQHKFGDEEPYLGYSGGYPNRTPRATYAAMISYFDSQVGMLVEQLKMEGIYDNTVIIFMSDNGTTLNNGVDARFFESAGIYPLSSTKGKDYLYEAGIRVPFFAVWPNHIERNSTSEIRAISYDILPTISEIIGADSPSKIDGVSILPTLLGEEQVAKHDYFYWENSDNTAHQAIIVGNWKLIGKNMSFQEPTFELYDLNNDPIEANDVSVENPEVVAKLKDLMVKVRTKPTYDAFKLNYWDVPKEKSGTGAHKK